MTTYNDICKKYHVGKQTVVKIARGQSVSLLSSTIENIKNELNTNTEIPIPISIPFNTAAEMYLKNVNPSGKIKTTFDNVLRKSILKNDELKFLMELWVTMHKLHFKQDTINRYFDIISKLNQ